MRDRFGSCENYSKLRGWYALILKMSFISASFKNSVPLNKMCILSRDSEKRKIHKNNNNDIYWFERKIFVTHHIHIANFPNLLKTSRSHSKLINDPMEKKASEHCCLLSFPKMAIIIFPVLRVLPESCYASSRCGVYFSFSST